MPLPPLPPGFQIDGAPTAAASLGRPILRKAPDVPAPRDPLAVRKDQLDIKMKERELAKPEGVKGGDAEKVAQEQAAGFYRRALYADALYNAKPQVQPRSALTQIGVNMLPEPLVQEKRSPQRREAENIADEFIRAKLRRESGAVIAPEEMAKEYDVYFPSPGDKPEDFARKAEFRKQAIAALRTQSGPLYRKINVDVANDLRRRAAQLRQGDAQARSKAPAAKQGGVKFLGFEGE